ncbi:MAG: Fe-S cluster assembly protein SufD [Bacteroidaceae bacterium]|nr:Fe-S cluster assembly protein SufD [Bacteroidaceae bacterium]
MSNEKEYIEIFDNNRPLIETLCSALLNKERAKAFEQFKSTGFPKRDDEEYRRTPIDKLFAADYGMNLGRLPLQGSPADFFSCDVPNLRARQEYIINDSFYRDAAEKSPLPEGVLLGSLDQFAQTHPELVEAYYNRQAQESDSLAQFNTTFVQDGLLLYVPRDTKLSEPIQIVTLLRSNIEMLSNRRLLIIIDQNATADLLICDHSSNDKQTLSTQVTEIFLRRGAALNIVEIEETGEKNSRLAHLLVNQESDSRLNHCCITLTNGLTRNNIKVTLAGSGAEAHLGGLAICDKNQHTDNNTLVEHKASHCNSSELYKYILDEEATGVFSGRMLICPDAQQTTSCQTNRNLCLTKCARMYAQPQLEIYADDVKCSHGSTVGQLDENALFYMQQRGISKDEARHLLMFAFAGEVIEKINIEALRDRLHLLIEKRFRGELNRCKRCALCKQ